MPPREENPEKFLLSFMFAEVETKKLTSHEATTIWESSLSTKEKQELVNKLVESRNDINRTIKELLEKIPTREEVKELVSKIQKTAEQRGTEFGMFFANYLREQKEKEES